MIDALTLSAIPAVGPGAAPRGARLSRRGAARPADGPAGAFVDGFRCRVQPRAGGTRLGRHDAAAGLWRRRQGRLPPLRAGRGTAVPRRAGVGALDRRPAERPADPEVRHRRAARLLPAAHLQGRGLLLHRHERAAERLRPGRAAHARHAHGRGLAAQGPEAVDHQCAPRALHDRAGAQQRRAGGPAPGPVADDRRPVAARHHRAHHRRPHRRPAFQRGLLRRRAAAARRADRRGGRRLGAGDGRAGLRAQRPRAHLRQHGAVRRLAAAPAQPQRRRRRPSWRWPAASWRTWCRCARCRSR